MPGRFGTVGTAKSLVAGSSRTETTVYFSSAGYLVVIANALAQVDLQRDLQTCLYLVAVRSNLELA